MRRFRERDLHEIMVSCGRYLESTLHLMLPFDLIEIDLVSTMRSEESTSIEFERRYDDVTFEKVPSLPQIPDGKTWRLSMIAIGLSVLHFAPVRPLRAMLLNTVG